MLKRLIIPAMVFCFTLFVVNAQNVDEIIKSNIEARGGLELLKELKTFKITGKIQTEGKEFDMSYFRKNPSKIRLQVDLNGQSGITVLNGDSSWIVDPSQKIYDPTLLTGKELSQVRPMIEYFFVFYDDALLNLKEKGIQPKFVKVDTVEGREVDDIQFTLPDGTDFTYCIDTHTHLDIRHIVKFNYMKEPFFISLKEFFENKGYILPHVIETRQGIKRKTRMVIDNLQIDNFIGDDLFEMKE